MKKLTLLFLFVGLISPLSQAQTLTAPVAKATLYPEGAQIQRKGSTRIAQGHQTLTITDLPDWLDPNNIRVSLPEEVKILSVAYHKNYLQENTTPPQIASLKKQIQAQEAEMADVEAREKAALLQMQYLDEQKAGPASQNAEQYAATLNLLEKRAYNIQKKLYQLSVQKEPLQQKLNELKAQLRQEEQAHQQRRGVVKVEVYASRITSADLSLQYFTNRAYWRNTYNARVSNLKDSLQLEQKAEAIQQTGENWENVELEFASAKPTQNQSLPALHPWQLGFFSPAARDIYSTAGQAAGVTEDAVTIRGSRSRGKVEFIDGVKVQGNAQYQDVGPTDRLSFQSIALPRKVNLASGSQAKTFDLRTIHLGAEYVYLSRPHQDQAVYLTALITDWEQYNLQSGQMDLFNGNTYIGKYFFNHRSPADTLELNLGKDDNFKVHMESKTTLETKMLSSKEELIHRYTIRIRNSKNNAARLRVQDQYPISTHEDLSVEVLESTAAEVDAKKGFLTWDTRIPAGEQRTFSFAYKLTYPKNKKPAL